MGLMITRRDLLLGAVSVAAFRDDTLALVERLVGSADPLGAEDEEFWAQIQEAFTLDRSMTNFNNGGGCPSPRVVQEALTRQLMYANQAPSYFMWQHEEPAIEGVRTRLASAFGAKASEIAITRNASEALEIALFGHDLHAGDEVLTSTLDYPRMITTIKQMERRIGVKLVQVRVNPSPKTTGEIVDAFERGITSSTKLMLVSHVCFQNGTINPVRDLCRLGEKHGIPVIVDGAHAFAQFPFMRDELECDMYGTSLHKWLMAPIGTGFLYVREPKVQRGDIVLLHFEGDLKANLAAVTALYRKHGLHPAPLGDYLLPPAPR